MSASNVKAFTGYNELIYTNGIKPTIAVFVYVMAGTRGVRGTIYTR